MDNEPEHKISNIMAVFLFTAAVFLDGIEMALTFIGVGLVVDWVISPLDALFLWTWLMFLGINLLKARNQNTAIVSFVVKMIPLVSALPAWTFLVFRVVANSRIEELTEGKKVAGDAEEEGGENSEEEEGTGGSQRILNAPTAGTLAEQTALERQTREPAETNTANIIDITPTSTEVEKEKPVSGIRRPAAVISFDGEKATEEFGGWENANTETKEELPDNKDEEPPLTEAA